MDFWVKPKIKKGENPLYLGLINHVADTETNNE